MNVVKFPYQPRPLSEAEEEQINAELYALLQMLNERVGQVMADSDESVKPFVMTNADFVLLARIMLLSRIQADSQLGVIFQHLLGGAA
jgi:hypothetical protein